MHCESMLYTSHAPPGGHSAGQTEPDAKNRISESIVLTIPADLQYVHILSRCACALLTELSGLCDAESTLYNLELAIQEVGVNIITHAYADQAGNVVMTAARDDERSKIIITLEDTGKSFDPLAVPTPELGCLQEHGFGLFLATELLDEVQYEIHAAGNRWHLKKSYTLHCHQ